MVFDRDDGLFSFAAGFPGTKPHLSLSATPTARGWHSHHHHFHLETPVGVELFIAVQLPGVDS